MGWAQLGGSAILPGVRRHLRASWGCRLRWLPARQASSHGSKRAREAARALRPRLTSHFCFRDRHEDETRFMGWGNRLHHLMERLQKICGRFCSTVSKPKGLQSCLYFSTLVRGDPALGSSRFPKPHLASVELSLSESILPVTLHWPPRTVCITSSSSSKVHAQPLLPAPILFSSSSPPGLTLVYLVYVNIIMATSHSTSYFLLSTLFSGLFMLISLVLAHFKCFTRFL